MMQQIVMQSPNEHMGGWLKIGSTVIFSIFQLQPVALQ